MIKKLPVFIAAALFCLSFSGCADNSKKDSAQGAAKAVYKKISAKEAKEIMDSGKSFILLDVRTAAEFKERRIAGAVLIPNYEIANRALAELPDKDAIILVYCRSGNRSSGAARELVKMGYTKVYDFGGISGWPYNTVSG
ncbi:MAG: rhodanese-like domain-containing protein [Endomicrobia bacterium]|nr:rhodanese-like domain-containing protein [Endomicrobiia bacterium]